MSFAHGQIGALVRSCEQEPPAASQPPAQAPLLTDSMVAPGTAANGRSGNAADTAVQDSAPSADAAVGAAEADPAAVATLRELCCDGASPEFLAHVLMRRCHGDLEVHTQ